MIDHADTTGADPAPGPGTGLHGRPVLDRGLTPRENRAGWAGIVAGICIGLFVGGWLGMIGPAVPLVACAPFGLLGLWLISELVVRRGR